MSTDDDADDDAIVIEDDIRDLVPGFVANRRSDVLAIEECLSAARFADIYRLGHSMKGTAGAYGFKRIGKLGARIEQAARAGDAPAIAALNRELEAYLATLPDPFPG